MRETAKKVPDIIELHSNRYTLDWIDVDKHEIDLNEISGFELHLRGDSWHVVVVTKERDNKDRPVTYELSHWVDISTIRKILSHPKAKVHEIVNYWRSDSAYFCKKLAEIL